MENNIQTQTLVKTYEMARNLSKYYISKLEGLDLKQIYEINGVKLNSAYWILGHLVWTEHFLIIEGIGGDSMNIDWLEDFSFGAEPEKIENPPDADEVFAKLDAVHTKAIDILNNLTDEQLQEKNNIEANFGGSKTKQNVLMHAIRHEPMHIGQLSWILKINGIKLT